MIKLNKTLVIILMTALIPLASAADINATFSGLENGQEIEDLNEVGLFPGDSGKWKITFEVNESTEVFITLNKTADDENTCEEPENEALDTCGDTGELDEFLGFNGFLDTDSDKEYDASENLFTVSENSTRIENPDTVDGNFSADNVYELIVNWNIPIESGSIFMTDSASYDVMMSAGSTINETNSEQETDQTESGSSSSSSFSTSRIESSDTEEAVENDNSDTSGEKGRLIVDVSNTLGDPLNSTINISEPADITDFTGDDGKAEFSLQEGNYSVTVTSTGYQEQISNTTVNLGEETVLNITLVSVEETPETETVETPETALETVTGAFTESRANNWILLLIVLATVSLIIYRYL